MCTQLAALFSNFCVGSGIRTNFFNFLILVHSRFPPNELLKIYGPLFVYFRSFHMTNIAQILYIIKALMVCLGLEPGQGIVDADESTELWRHSLIEKLPKVFS